jgi:prevent-host-death family protein
MNEVPTIVPVTDLRYKHNELFKRLSEGPVILAQRSKPAAVLVSVADWNQQVKQIRELQLLLLHYKRRAEMQREPADTVTHEELERQLTEKAAA